MWCGRCIAPQCEHFESSTAERAWCERRFLVCARVCLIRITIVARLYQILDWHAIRQIKGPNTPALYVFCLDYSPACRKRFYFFLPFVVFTMSVHDGMHKLSICTCTSYTRVPRLPRQYTWFTDVVAAIGTQAKKIVFNWFPGKNFGQEAISRCTHVSPFFSFCFRPYCSYIHNFMHELHV